MHGRERECVCVCLYVCARAHVHTPSLSLSLFISRSHSHPHTHTHTKTNTHSLSLTQTPFHTHKNRNKHTLSLTHTHKRQPRSFARMAVKSHSIEIGGSSTEFKAHTRLHTLSFSRTNPHTYTHAYSIVLSLSLSSFFLSLPLSHTYTSDEPRSFERMTVTSRSDKIRGGSTEFKTPCVEACVCGSGEQDERGEDENDEYLMGEEGAARRDDGE